MATDIARPRPKTSGRAPLVILMLLSVLVTVGALVFIPTEPDPDNPLPVSPLVLGGLLATMLTAWLLLRGEAKANPRRRPAGTRTTAATTGQAGGVFDGPSTGRLGWLGDFGWHVADDVPFAGFDVDHVAVGPGGVLAIAVEEALGPLGGQIVPADAVTRAERNAEWVTKVLQGKGVGIPVAPVVLATSPELPALHNGSVRQGSTVVLSELQREEWVADLDRPHLPQEAIDAVRAAIAGYVDERRRFKEKKGAKRKR